MVFQPFSRSLVSWQLHWMQSAAIFACCTNLFSTVLANVGMAIFLVLFVWTCFTDRRKRFDWENFPWTVAAAIGLYISWQIVGLSYTDAPMASALKSIYSDRKIIYILPLALVFSDEQTKLRLLRAFLLVSSIALTLSLFLKIPVVQANFHYEAAFVLRSHATQGMVFAMSAFLSGWFALQQTKSGYRYGFYILAVAFFLNLALVTPGRSGYVVFLVLTVWCFAMSRGFKGVLLGALVAVAVGGAAFVLSPSLKGRVMSGIVEAQNYSTDASETSLGRRMVMVDASIEMIRKNTLVGVGTGGYQQHFSAIAAERYTGWRAKPFDDPHNQYLFVWTENGLVGLATFVLMLVVIFRRCARGDVYARMAAGCMLAWCATSFFSGHFRTFPEGHLIAFVVGMLMISRPSAQTDEKFEIQNTEPSKVTA
jgi:O-antigen ligase